MGVIERLKKKIVSRLTGEADITYFRNTIDKKVAKLIYKDREIIVQEKRRGYMMFLRRSNEYVSSQDYFAGHTEEQAIDEAKGMIKNDDIWRESTH